MRFRRGVAATEFALTLPVLLAVLLGVVELSRMMNQMHLVTRAARDGARLGAGTIEGQDPTGDIIEAATEAHALEVLEAGGINCAGACEAEAEWFVGDNGWWMLSVEVSVPYDPFTSYLPSIPNLLTAEFTTLTQQQ